MGDLLLQEYIFISHERSHILFISLYFMVKFFFITTDDHSQIDILLSGINITF